MTAALIVAEPEADVRSFLERQLRIDGFDVVGTTAPAETLELAERARPDLVLVATELGGGSGLEVCRRLREGEPGRAWDRRRAGDRPRRELSGIRRPGACLQPRL